MSLDDTFIKAFHAHHEAGDLFHTSADHAHEVFQTSTINALIEGVYDGATRFDTLLQHGDFGLGTFNGLDGEMTAVDGVVYQIRSDGQVYPVTGDMQTPFAVMMLFDPTLRVEIDEHMDFANFAESLDAAVPSRNIFYAIRADGRFMNVKVRSVPRQEPPYRPLTEVVESQPVYTYDDIEGTLVGFRFPDYAQGINVPGYHLHFLDRDRKVGGHVMGFHTHHARVEIDITSGFHMELPDSGAFLGANLSKDSGDAIKKVEK